MINGLFFSPSQVQQLAVVVTPVPRSWPPAVTTSLGNYPARWRNNTCKIWDLKSIFNAISMAVQPLVGLHPCTNCSESTLAVEEEALFEAISLGVVDIADMAWCLSCMEKKVNNKALLHLMLGSVSYGFMFNTNFMKKEPDSGFCPLL